MESRNLVDNSFTYALEDLTRGRPKTLGSLATQDSEGTLNSDTLKVVSVYILQ